MCVKIEGGGDVPNVYVPHPTSEVESMMRSAGGDKKNVMHCALLVRRSKLLSRKPEIQGKHVVMLSFVQKKNEA